MEILHITVLFIFANLFELDEEMCNKSVFYLLVFDSPILNLSVLKLCIFPHSKFAPVFNIYFSTQLTQIVGPNFFKKMKARGLMMTQD